jgi:hypothetical protein
MRFWPRKRFFIWLAILVGVLLLANGIFACFTRCRLKPRIAPTPAAGDPASITDLAPEPIPADENAAAYLEELAPRLDEFSKEYGRFYKSPLGEAYQAAEDRGEPPTPDQIAAIRAILDKYPDIDQSLAAAAACDQYASLADFTLDHQEFLDEVLNKRIIRLRTATRFLNWRMEVLLAGGQQEQAIEQGIEILRLARLYDHEPTLVNMLVCDAVRGIAAQSLYDALAAGPASPELHAALEQELALHDDPQRMVRALKTERAFAIDFNMGLPSDAPKPKEWLFHMFSWTVKRFSIGVLDYFDVEIKAVGRPWLEMHHEVGRRQVPQEPSGYGVLADLLIPATQAAYDADARTTATLRALRIFNALTQYRDEHGREASGLDDLSLPKEATIDPFSGEPLLLKHTDDGWIIYSVMTNGVDDGGDFKDQKDWGVAPRTVRAKE